MIDLIIFIVLIAVLYLTIQGPPFVPTRAKEMQTVFNLSGASKNRKMVDLGSGDGRLVIYFAERGIESHGYEINPLLYLFSKFQISRKRLKDTAHVHLKSFWKADLREADVIVVFGIGHIMNKLERKLKNELKPGSIVISNTFKFKNLNLEKKDKIFFLYRI